MHNVPRMSLNLCQIRFFFTSELLALWTLKLMSSDQELVHFYLVNSLSDLHQTCRWTIVALLRYFFFFFFFFFFLTSQKLLYSEQTMRSWTDSVLSCGDRPWSTFFIKVPFREVAMLRYINGLEGIVVKSSKAMWHFLLLFFQDNEFSLQKVSSQLHANCDRKSYKESINCEIWGWWYFNRVILFRLSIFI